MDEINNQNMLQVGTILHGTYKIESYLASGGFGNTYLAKNIEFDETYAIKEFFVKGVCQRDGNSTTISVSNAENTNSFEQQREKFKKKLAVSVVLVILILSRSMTFSRRMVLHIM